MKLLIENWRKFIKEEIEDSEDVSFSNEFEEKMEKVFDEHPEIAKKILKVTNKYLEDSSLSEQEEIKNSSEEEKNNIPSPIITKDLEKVLGILAGSSFSIAALIEEFGSRDAGVLEVGLGLTGIFTLLGLLAGKARESLEKKEK